MIRVGGGRGAAREGTCERFRRLGKVIRVSDVALQVAAGLGPAKDLSWAFEIGPLSGEGTGQLPARGAARRRVILTLDLDSHRKSREENMGSEAQVLPEMEWSFSRDLHVTLIAGNEAVRKAVRKAEWKGWQESEE